MGPYSVSVFRIRILGLGPYSVFRIRIPYSYPYFGAGSVFRIRILYPYMYSTRYFGAGSVFRIRIPYPYSCVVRLVGVSAQPCGACSCGHVQAAVQGAAVEHEAVAAALLIAHLCSFQCQLGHCVKLTAAQWCRSVAGAVSSHGVQTAGYRA